MRLLQLTKGNDRQTDRQTSPPFKGKIDFRVVFEFPEKGLQTHRRIGKVASGGGGPSVFKIYLRHGEDGSLETMQPL